MTEKEKEYEVEEEERGDVIKWFYVTRKKDGEQFTVSVNYSATTDSTTITAFDTAHKKEQKEIEETVRKYIMQKEERTITIEVKGGTIIDVKKLPEGTNYEVIDHDVNEEV